MKVAIQGQVGSYHHVAAQKFYGNDTTIVPCVSFREVFEMLASGHVDTAIVALENSLYGSLNETYDYLLDFKPTIIGEVYLHIQFNLFAVPGTNIEQITDVYSHPAALGECKEYLHDHLPWARTNEYHDTAAAAEYIAQEKNSSKAAIASKAAGELHDLEPIAEEIDDNKHNYTRFAVLSMQQKTIMDANKTSIILHTAHKPGALYAVLGIFKKHNANLTKIESRPLAGRDWNYVFYLDFECADSDVRRAIIEELHTQDQSCTILGSYLSGEMPKLT
jgi:prephenate dehydratase